ncbi:hypothetical protein [Alkalihalobacillus sp. 1P02AB]|uniref:hypothetical protein n=1 Tax=Alkalihalobacillus sp. 1P02AB TaxID=3132260 RepID=UPI0039A563D5
MPTTKKESLYFGLMMCFGMVIGMTVYNLFLNDLIGIISFQGIIIQLLIGFIFAFLLESFIVGPITHKIVSSILYDRNHKLLMVLFTSIIMVTGMVTFMSLYGLGTFYYYNGLGDASFFQHYKVIVFQNFIFALPLQLIIVGPIVRFLFVKMVKKAEDLETEAAKLKLIK